VVGADSAAGHDAVNVRMGSAAAKGQAVRRTSGNAAPSTDYSGCIAVRAAASRDLAVH
jgi:hypothetical protein